MTNICGAKITIVRDFGEMDFICHKEPNHSDKEQRPTQHGGTVKHQSGTAVILWTP